MGEALLTRRSGGGSAGLISTKFSFTCTNKSNYGIDKSVTFEKVTGYNPVYLEATVTTDRDVEFYSGGYINFKYQDELFISGATRGFTGTATLKFDFTIYHRKKRDQGFIEKGASLYMDNFTTKANTPVNL